MAIQKKISKLKEKKMLGALLILALAAFGSMIVSNYVMKFEFDVMRVVIATLFVGGLLAVFIEMRGTIGKRATRIRSRVKARIKSRNAKRKKKK